jgi:gliding motility-associated lipoprotein GldD
MIHSCMKYFIVGCLICLLYCSCESEDFTPKQRGYYKIEFPERTYVTFNQESYPYSFEFPAYASIEKDTLFFDQKAENPWWININFKSLGGKVYLSYKIINAANPLKKLLEDSYQMSHFHTKKADYINEPEFHTPNNVHGIYYDVGGNAASAFQFFATDSVKHFLRGALYFDATPNADSLKPINEFLIEDIMHMVNTLKWTR